MNVQKWAITGWISVAVMIVVTAILLLAGTGKHGLGIGLRVTAQISVILFSLAFSAAGLFKLNRNPFTTWLRRNRRYVGVGFAVTHFIHLGLIGWVALAYPNPFFAERGATEFLGGGIAYAFIAAMTATSFDRTARMLGPKRWRMLHLAGGWYIWFIFAQRYVKTAVVDPFYIPLALLTLGVLAIRVWHRYQESP